MQKMKITGQLTLRELFKNVGQEPKERVAFHEINPIMSTDYNYDDHS